MKRAECRLTIQQDESTRALVVEYWDSFGGKATGKVQKTSLTEKTVERFHRWAAKHAERCERDDLRVLGLHLYNILFDDPVGKVFNKACEDLEAW